MFVALLAAALAFSPEDARLAFETARGLVEQCTPRDAGTIRGWIAANYILDAASAAGADVRRDVFTAMTPTGERKFVNLSAEFKSAGESNKWVIVVSHYDTKPGVVCPGANDGASTSGILVGLANAVMSWADRHGNLMLIWTDGEECQQAYSPNDGFWGSKRAVQQIAARKLPVQAVICIDMLGDRDLSISVPANGTPALARIALHAARRIGSPGLVKTMDELVKDDHVAFLDAGYKAIDLIDFSYGPNNGFWHTEKDTMENVSEASIRRSGELVVEMLNILL